MADRTIAVKLTADIAQFERNLRRAAQTTGQVGRDILTTAEKSAQAFNTLGVAMGAAGAVGALALKQIAGEAIAFESAWAGVTKTVSGTEQQMAALSQGLRRMATQDVPVSVNALADIAASAGQLGVRTESIEGFTRVIADLGVATNLSGEQAATSLARLANITQMPQESFDRLGSTVVALGNSMATTEAEIVEMSLRLAGAGAQIGMTEAQILSFAAGLSEVGIEAEAGGTAFSRVMVDIAQAAAEGGAKLNQFAEVAGMSAEEFATAFATDPAEAIVAFVGGLGAISDAGGNTFGVLEDLELGEVRVRDALLRTAGAGEGLAEAIDLGTQAWEDNTALVEEAEQRYATTESQIQFARNALADLGIEMGENLLPLITALAGTVGDLAGFFGRLPEPVQTLAVAFVGIASAIGLVGGAMLLALPRIAATKLALAELGFSAAATRTALMSLNTVGVIGGIGAAVVAIGALTSNLAAARAEAEQLADAIALEAGDDPADQLAAMNDELERQMALRGNAGNRLVDAFFHPFQTQDEIAAVEELTDRVEALDQAAQLQGMVDFAIYTKAAAQATDGWAQRTIAANEALEQTEAATRDYRQALAGAGIDTEAFGRDVQTTMQLTAQEIEDALGSFQGRADNFGGYRQALADLNAAHREAAREADQAYTDITASADLYVQNLHDQVAAQHQWGILIAEAQARGLDNIAAEIMAAGPDHNELYTDLLITGPMDRATEAEAALEEQVRQTIANMALTVDEDGPDFIDGWGRIGGNAVEAIAEELGLTPEEVGSVLESSEAVARERGVLLEETFGHLGSNAVEAIATALSAGTVRIGSITRDYAAAIAAGVSPVVQQLGGRPVVVTPGSFVPGSQGGFKPNADGNLYENHQAEIAPGGAMRLWAEPETGGEAYIPLSPAKRDRSLRIWEETGRRLGVEHFADGGFSSVDDIPGVPSYAPFTPDVVDPGQMAAAMIQQQAIEWLKANLAPPLGPGIGSAAMMAALRTRFPGLQLISGFRPGAITATGNPSYHGMDRAVDIPPRTDVNHWIYDNYKPQTRELIASWQGARQIRNGRDHYYTGITRAMHFGHNHWAMANGGIVRSTPGGTSAILGEGGSDEAVIPLDRPLGVNVQNWSGLSLGDLNLSIGLPEAITIGEGIAEALGGLGPAAPQTHEGPVSNPNVPWPTPVTRGPTPEQLAEIRANTEMLRLEALPAEERLLEIAERMAWLDSMELTNNNEYVALLREAEGLEEGIARAAAEAAAEIERQAEAQRRAAEEAERAAQAMADAAQQQADRLGDELIGLMEQRDRLNQQAADASAAYARAAAEAQLRTAREIDDLIAARSRALFGGFGALGQRFEAGWGNLASQYSDELDNRFSMFDEWADGLQSLRDRGLSEDVIAQLGLDDPSKLADVRLFVNATDAELQRLNRSLTRNQGQAASAATREADLLLGALGDAITEARSRLADTLDGLRDDLDTRLGEIADQTALLGMETGYNYASALQAALESGLPGVIAIAQQFQDALADAEAAAAAAAALAGQVGSNPGTVGGGATHNPNRPSWDGSRRDPNSGVNEVGSRLFDSGGILPPGMTLAHNQTGQNEYVLTAQQLRTMRPASSGQVTAVVAGPVTIQLDDGRQLSGYIQSQARQAARDDAYGRQLQGVH